MRVVPVLLSEAIGVGRLPNGLGSGKWADVVSFSLGRKVCQYLVRTDERYLGGGERGG